MADRPKGMGRGLAAILSVAPKDESEELRQLPVDLIEPNPRQPRTSIQRPRSFSPSRRNLRRPLRYASRASPSGIQVPRSHSSTVPAPYCFGRMTPSKPPYSIG